MARLMTALSRRRIDRTDYESRRGVSLIESAFIIPIMMSLIFGAIEFGTLLHMRHTMLHAAREGARALAVQGATTGQAVADVQALLPGDPADFDFEVTATAPAPDSLDRDVVVEVSLPYADASLGDMFGLFGDDRMVVSVTMRSEQ
jgi:hypothetical protein